MESDDNTDECESPAYVCGTATEAWHAQLVCTLATPAGSNPATGCGKSVNSYEAWHWVVAPSPSACSTDAEPGFLTTASDASAEYPYLAHDLDVYTPAATAAGSSGTPNLESAVTNTVNNVTGQVTDLIPESPTEAPDTGEVTEALPEVAVTDNLTKVDRIEPNAPGDNSQDPAFSFDRDLESDRCNQLRSGTEDVAEPWVNIIDNQVNADPAGGNTDLYMNNEPNQDASNRPGYGLYFTSGHVGMFTDMNDDGAYSQIGSEDKYDDINEVGAYEMVWDIHTNKTKLADTEDPMAAMEGGCQPGFSDNLLTDSAKEGGYGPKTGLIQVIYLNEPTTIGHLGTLDTF